MYAALFATWIPLAWLVIATGGDRGGTSGLTTGTVAPWHYLLTQCEAIVRYLQLVVWPHPLVLDYGIGIHREWQAVTPQGILLVALAAGGAWLWWRRPRWGFFAVWFFATLAPSSSIVPLATQPVAEHRMYLPLAALTTLAALILHAVARSRRLAVVAFAVVGALLAGLTARRNHDYRNAIAIWTDTVDKVPGNARARNQLGRALREAGRRDDAAMQFEAALRLDPTLADAHYNVGLDRDERGERAAAEEHYRAAVQLHPRHAQARLNLAALLNDAGRWSEAIAFSEESVRLRPDDAALHLNLGAALLGAGRPRDALAPLQRAVTFAPDDPRAHGNLANALALTDRFDEAADHYETALRLHPDYARAHENYALLLLHLGRATDAVSHLEAALRLEPANDRLRAHLDHARAEVSASSPQ
jgi:tetratricopeptide (TPR) repeat protein